MEQKLIIKAKMPTLNEYVNACRGHNKAGGKMAKEYKELVGWYIKTADTKLMPCTGKVDIDFVWQEANGRRDHDNVAFAKKFILDALVDNGILQGDGQRHVGNFTDTLVNGQSYGVMVLIKEREDAQ